MDKVKTCLILTLEHFCSYGEEVDRRKIKQMIAILHYWHCMVEWEVCFGVWAAFGYCWSGGYDSPVPARKALYALVGASWAGMQSAQHRLNKVVLGSSFSISV